MAKTAEERAAIDERVERIIRLVRMSSQPPNTLVRIELEGFGKQESEAALREARDKNCPACRGHTPFSTDAVFFMRGNGTYEHFGAATADGTYTCRSDGIRALLGDADEG